MIRLTRAQVREVDRLAIEKYHVPGIVLMENAARAVSDVAIGMCGADAGVVIVCGGGNNGGDGLAVARHLHNRGCYVNVVDAWEKEPTGDAGTNLRIVRAMGLETVSMYDAEDVLNPHAFDFVIDAVFGTGLSRPPEGVIAIVLQMINECGLPVLAIDVPSGLDCDTGKPLGPACVRATKTVTFVAEKAGFANPESKQYTGEVIVGDIGCPKEIIEEVLRGAR